MDNNLVGVTFKSYSTLWVKPIPPHQLRHTCATHLFQQGGNIVHIKDWLGHKKITTTLHYACIQNPEIAATLESHPINGALIPPRPEVIKIKGSRKKPASTFRRNYTMTVVADPFIGQLADQIEEFLRTAEGLNKYSKGSLKEFRFSLTRFAVGCPSCLENGIQTLRGVDIIRWLSARRQVGISQCTIDNPQTPQLRLNVTASRIALTNLGLLSSHRTFHNSLIAAWDTILRWCKQIRFIAHGRTEASANYMVFD